MGGTWAKFGANVDKIREHDQRSGKGGSEERAEAKGKGESLQLKRGQRERERVRASEEGPEELNVL